MHSYITILNAVSITSHWQHPNCNTVTSDIGKYSSWHEQRSGVALLDGYHRDAGGAELRDRGFERLPWRKAMALFSDGLIRGDWCGWTSRLG